MTLGKRDLCQDAEFVKVLEGVRLFTVWWIKGSISMYLMSQMSFEHRFQRPTNTSNQLTFAHPMASWPYFDKSGSISV
jgi:hypothetical protein